MLYASHRAEIAGMTAVVKRLRAISIGFHRLGISREEFVLLRFLVLLNSGERLLILLITQDTLTFNKLYDIV